MNYLNEPYTRWRIISNILSSVLYLASSAIIYLQFKRTLPINLLLTLDNVWSPVVIFIILLVCNTYRERIISKIYLITFIFGSSLLLVDICLFIVNDFSIMNYVIQIITDVTIWNIYGYSFDGFNSKVFDKADSLQKFTQWANPIYIIFGILGGSLGVIFSTMSLRFLVLIQIVYDILWVTVQFKTIYIGKEKIRLNTLL